MRLFHLACDPRYFKQVLRPEWETTEHVEAMAMGEESQKAQKIVNLQSEYDTMSIL